MRTVTHFDPEEVVDIENTFIDTRPRYKDGQVAGTYAIEHVETGKLYVGSTVDLYRRESQHFSMLRLGTHPVKELQSLYQQSSEVSVCRQYTDTKTEALALEQKLLDDHYGLSHCLNVSPDAQVAFKGLRHSDSTKEILREKNTGKTMPTEAVEKIRQAMLGRAVSEETCEKIRQLKLGVPRPPHAQEMLRGFNEARSRPVQVGETQYPSVAAAARAFGVDNRTVENRINSQTSRFTEWSFVQKENCDGSAKR